MEKGRNSHRGEILTGAKFSQGRNSHFLMSIPEECEIAMDLENRVKDNNLLKLPLPVMHRILHRYLLNGNKITKNILDFLFKEIDAQGRDASVLFSLVPCFEDDEMEMYMIQKLYNEYKETFEFCFLSGSHVLRMIEKLFTRT